MCFPRKPGLGNYNGSRKEWRQAYRTARIEKALGNSPNPASCGISWKAQLIVSHERDPITDSLTLPVSVRLRCIRMINKMNLKHSKT